MRSGRWLTAVVAGVGLAVGATSCAGESARGALVGFVELGTLQATDIEVQAAWLGSDEATELAEALEDAARADDGSADLDDARLTQALAALDHQPARGSRGVAFVLAGCADTGAELTIDGSLVGAELVESGGRHTNCDVAVYFLAVFEVPEDLLPDDPRLDR